MNKTQSQAHEFKIKKSFTIKDILETCVGRTVKAVLIAGGEIEGTVNTVGDSVVQFSEILGMNYYDAVIRIDSIASVMLKVRGS